MKFGAISLSLVLGLAAVGTQAAQLQQNPMARVATLLSELKARIESDGVAEQTSYDKYACWCEDTLATKAGDISKAKEDIESLTLLIERLSGEISAHSVEIKQLETDVATNKESQKEATTVRRTGNEEYEGEKTETEQCIGALETAIKVLAGAGTGKGFLETVKQAQLLSVVAEVRGVLERPVVAKKVTNRDLQLVRQFVAHPDDFVGDHAGFLSAAQTGKNPFGDYAPKSTQIQGILKGMYDGFAADLEKGNAQEANAQKAHEELMEVKRQELSTLEATLDTQTLDHARKASTMAESKERLDDTKVQLAADEKLFGELKLGCQNKASEWAARTRIRTEELAGVQQAIAILTDEENQKVFSNATTTFLQLGAVAHASEARLDAYAELARLARQFRSFGLAQLAVDAKSGGHFDKIMVSIDHLIADLRKEAQDDIEHRDRCEGATGKNSIDKEDLDHAIQKATTAIEVLEGEETQLTEKVGSLEGNINTTKQDIQDALDMRVGEVAEFRQALQDDADAIALLGQAIAALTRVYKDNKIPLALVAEEPNYSDAPPETSWSGSYGGRSGESHGIISILTLLKEDLEKEVQSSRKDDARSQAQYERERGAMSSTLKAQVGLKTATEKELVGVGKELQDKTDEKGSHEDDLTSNGEMKTALEKDCTWVDTHFNSRRESRETEIQGLIDAKGYLAGVTEDN